MIALKQAKKWNPIDLVAAKTIREQCGGGWIPWGRHVQWWCAGGYEQCWFAVSGMKRIGYVRVDKGGYVSIAVLEPWRRGGVGEHLLREVRSHIRGMLWAVIQRENITSRALFFRSGYTYCPSAEGSEYVLMRNRGNEQGA